MAFYQNFAEIPSVLEKDCITYATVQQLFKHFEGYYKTHNEIPHDSLTAFDSIFGETLEKSLEIIDSGSVKYLWASSASVGVFQVEGNFHKSYIIFPYINYCPCLAYKYKVASGTNITCKHVLATIIAKITGKTEEIEISPSQLYNLLLKSASVNERSPKLLVTEEKMAAHLSNLRISEADGSRLRSEDEAMDTDRLPKLFICDEVRNYKSDPIIPESIMNKIERPSMAVVLWKPPTGELNRKLEEIRKYKKRVKAEKEENDMIVENNNIDNTFRPIDPVPMNPSHHNQFLHPIPHFHGYTPFS